MKAMKVTIHAAKTTLSQLIERAHAGEEIVIARGEVPVAPEPHAQRSVVAERVTLRRRVQQARGGSEQGQSDRSDGDDDHER